MNCVCCKSAIERLDLLKCNLCQGNHHYRCVNITSAAFRENSAEIRRTFKCESCVNVTRRKTAWDERQVRGAAAVAAVATCDGLPTVREMNSGGLAVTMDTNHGGLDKSMLFEMINEAVSKAMKGLEAGLVTVIKDTVMTFTNQETTRLKAELNEANEKCLQYQKEIQTLKTKIETQPASSRNQKGSTRKLQPRLDESSNLAAKSPVIVEVNPPLACSVAPAPSPTPSLESPAIENRSASYAAVARNAPVITDDQQKRTVSTTADDGNWIEVKTKRHLYPINKGGNTSTLQIKAIERKKWFHIWRLLKETTENDLLEYIQKILGNDKDVKVHKINHKIERGYASFRVCVGESDYELLYNPVIWPKDAEYSEWVWFRDSNGKPQSQIAQ